MFLCSFYAAVLVCVRVYPGVPWYIRVCMCVHLCMKRFWCVPALMYVHQLASMYGIIGYKHSLQ